jgi:hypothetical protein
MSDVSPAEKMPGLGAMPVLANALPASQLIPLDKFDDERRKRIAELAATVQITDSNSIMTFGTEPQRRMNAFLDEMLKGVRTDETGAAGELIMELSTTIKGLPTRCRICARPPTSCRRRSCRRVLRSTKPISGT